MSILKYKLLEPKITFLKKVYGRVPELLNYNLKNNIV